MQISVNMVIVDITLLNKFPADSLFRLDIAVLEFTLNLADTDNYRVSHHNHVSEYDRFHLGKDACCLV